MKDGRTSTKNGMHMHLGRGGPLRIIEILSPDDEKDGGQPETTSMEGTSILPLVSEVSSTSKRFQVLWV